MRRRTDEQAAAPVPAGARDSGATPGCTGTMQHGVPRADGTTALPAARGGRRTPVDPRRRITQRCGPAVPSDPAVRDRSRVRGR
ncbi:MULTISPECIES: hypothetical protein [unclassified Pseudonocardia]|uniref:hypothetical protein n=1 Tax=unclassified Pseudonocardia TaxID=2619320 RepID=UPI00111530EF|nr:MULTISPECIES: hypothetical protein [unclassified Pseudonocardia]